MKAKFKNKTYKINETEKNRYYKEGYDIYKEDGTPHMIHEKPEQEIKKLKDEIKQLKAELKKHKK